MKYCTLKTKTSANFVKNFVKRGLFYVVFLGGVWFALSACQPAQQARLEHLQGQTMGTEYHVKLVDAPAELDIQALHQQLEQRLKGINDLLSTYQEDSELSRFNQNPSTDWVDISPPLLFVIQAALDISQASNGAFDITVGPLVNLWGFGPAVKADEIPAEKDIAAAQARVGFQYLHIRSEPPALKKTLPDLYLDLSAIAKGYAVDQLAEHLEQQGIINYLVDIGGELRTAGHNAQQQIWRVAIEQPVPGQRAVQRIIQVPTLSVATSGSYRNFFQLQGRRFSHTINPHSGWPVKHRLVSASVLHPQAMQADAWATTFMVLGVEKALQLAEQKNLAVFLLEDTDDGVLEHASSSFLLYQTE